ncbi:MAG: ATP-binding cassette domain-containing protein [Rhodanobacteraceae bacterium]|jgi:ATP-binding cassette subfamily F protein 3|nr:ATP-binding cassette domain-containing protein [Rhodanobacteraceae bacterium]
MLRFDNLTLRRGSRLLLNGASFLVHPGWRVGLTGRNGSGKSSLLALISGELAPDGGDFGRPRDWTLAHVRQHADASDRSALDHVLDGDAEFRALERDLAAAEAAHDAARQAALHERLHAIGGYAARARAGELLHGLGFAPGDEARAVADFSGGWRMRLNLGQALMCRSDLLLLDEPTNHLDLDAVLWLEDWLRRYAGTLIVVSHDREFLDHVVSHVLHIADENAELFAGSVSAFERKRAERLAQQQVAHERQQAERARLQRFVDRFKAKATKARQAQSRVKALERMTEIAVVRVESGIEFEFAQPDALPDPLLTFTDVAVGYGERRIVERAKLSLRPGDRIGLLGANGAGKSTLIKTIAGTLAPLDGERRANKGLAIGYFAQHQIEQLDLDATPVQHLLRLQPTLGEQAARDFLGTFGFAGERALATVRGFSGGEKARLALALIVFARPNLLLLDEPTNHLDIDTREALAEALQDFAGAVVLVAHDRGLLRAVCDDYLLVRDGRVQPFDGDLDDYARLVLRGSSAPTTPGATTGSSGGDTRRDARRDRAEQRARLAPLKNTVARIEKQIAELEAQQARVQAELADPALYEAAAGERVAALVRQQGQLAQQIAATEEAWLEAHAALDLAAQE